MSARGRCADRVHPAAACVDAHSGCHAVQARLAAPLLGPSVLQGSPVSFPCGSPCPRRPPLQAFLVHPVRTASEAGGELHSQQSGASSGSQEAVLELVEALRASGIIDAGPLPLHVHGSSSAAAFQTGLATSPRTASRAALYPLPRQRAQSVPLPAHGDEAPIFGAAPAGGNGGSTPVPMPRPPGAPAGDAAGAQPASPGGAGFHQPLSPGRAAYAAWGMLPPLMTSISGFPVAAYEQRRSIELPGEGLRCPRPMTFWGQLAGRCLHSPAQPPLHRPSPGPPR